MVDGRAERTTGVALLRQIIVSEAGADDLFLRIFALKAALLSLAGRLCGCEEPRQADQPRSPQEQGACQG